MARDFVESYAAFAGKMSHFDAEKFNIESAHVPWDLR